MTEQQNKTKDQLKVIALRQRIGEITSNYEEMIADMRADITQTSQVMQDEMNRQLKEIEDKNNEIDSLNRKIDDFQEEQRGNKKAS
jgi:hypothetical protein